MTERRASSEAIALSVRVYSVLFGMSDFVYRVSRAGMIGRGSTNFKTLRWRGKRIESVECIDSTD